MTPIALVNPAAPNGPDPAAAQDAPPAPGDVTETGAAGPTSDGAAQLDERRKARGARGSARRRKRARARKPAGEVAAAAVEPDEPEDDAEAGDEKSAAELHRDATALLGVVYRLAGVVVGLFGGRMAKVERGEAAEDAKSLVPLMQKWDGFARFVGYLAAPFVIVQRVAEKTTRAEPAQKGTKSA